MDGLLLIDKPAGITSHDVVDRIRRIASTRRVGHAGTLDPFATGLLVLGVNAGTKQLTKLIGLDKEYIATAILGFTSTTDDPEGIITEYDTHTHPLPNKETIERILDHFRGGYLQTAPAYSAKKVGGKKLYELARQGRIDSVILPTKHVTIHALEILTYEGSQLTFRVHCSSGTYIRSLARDIGDALGTGAYLTALRRTSVGSFRVSDSLPLSDCTIQTLSARLIPLT